MQDEKLKEVVVLFERNPRLRQMINNLNDPNHLTQLLSEYSLFNENVTEPSKEGVLTIISQRINAEGCIPKKKYSTEKCY